MHGRSFTEGQLSISGCSLQCWMQWGKNNGCSRDLMHTLTCTPRQCCCCQMCFFVCLFFLLFFFILETSDGYWHREFSIWVLVPWIASILKYLCTSKYHPVLSSLRHSSFSSDLPDLLRYVIIDGSSSTRSWSFRFVLYNRRKKSSHFYPRWLLKCLSSPLEIGLRQWLHH